MSEEPTAKAEPKATAPYHLMAKPAGPRCNMACRYCFYLEKDALVGETGPARMPDDVLEAYIRGYARTQDGPELTYAWQGGEPTLAGLDFFRKAVALQQRYAGGRRVSNSFQTNGVLLDDEWCAFLAEHHFLIGVSVDGPQDIQDHYRLDRRGRGHFDDILHALDCLKRNRVDFNTLTVVSDANVRRPLDVYRFLREQGVEHMQFIPLVERKLDDRAAELGLELAVPPVPGKRGGRQAVMPWCPDPAAYGEFLSAMFDEWIRHDVGRVFVQIFEVALGNWMGLGAGLCHFAPTCGRAMVLEANGDVYACDHYVYPEYRRGNILERPMNEIADDPEQRAFGEAKRDSLPVVCRNCGYLFACNGGCPKHRFLKSNPDDPGLNYLCAGYQKFFTHVDPYLRQLGQLLREGRPAQEIMSIVARQDEEARWRSVDRNAPCPCGSGRKFKHCHGERKVGAAPPRTT